MAIVFVAIPSDFKVSKHFPMINELINKIGRSKVNLKEIEECVQNLISAEPTKKQPKQEVIGITYDVINKLGFIIDPQIEEFSNLSISAIVNVTNSKWEEQIRTTLPKGGL